MCNVETVCRETGDVQDGKRFSKVFLLQWLQKGIDACIREERALIVVNSKFESHLTLYIHQAVSSPGARLLPNAETSA